MSSPIAAAIVAIPPATRILARSKGCGLYRRPPPDAQEVMGGKGVGAPWLDSGRRRD
jgi:hypothetical protein